MNAVLKFHAVESLVDQLGRLQAQLADLQAAEKALKEDLKIQACATLAVGKSVRIEGSLFSATIIETAAVKSLDPKALETKLRAVLGDDDAFFSDANNIKTRAGAITLKITARKVA